MKAVFAILGICLVLMYAAALVNRETPSQPFTVVVVIEDHIYSFNVDSDTKGNETCFGDEAICIYVIPADEEAANVYDRLREDN